MRLPSQKLPKAVNKKTRTVKHKDSAKKMERLALKKAAAEGMDVVADSSRPPMTEEEKEAARAARKKMNVSKVSYKKVKCAR